jgi:hypothetical protein
LSCAGKVTASPASVGAVGPNVMASPVVDSKSNKATSGISMTILCVALLASCATSVEENNPRLIIMDNCNFFMVFDLGVKCNYKLPQVFSNKCSFFDEDTVIEGQNGRKSR